MPAELLRLYLPGTDVKIALATAPFSWLRDGPAGPWITWVYKVTASLQIKRVSQRYHCLHEGRVGRVFSQALHGRGVELQHVHRQPLEVREGGILLAKVVAKYRR
jgi:hypothetical protein